jgi:hypothetical protein
MSTTTATVAGTYARIAALPLRIDGYELSGRELALTERYTRMTTVVRLHGAGQEGEGEDTTYAMPDQLGFRAAGLDLALAGDWTIDTFSPHLKRLDLFPSGPSSPDFRNFRCWAFESAAVDLALRQAGVPLAVALGRVSRPVRFVVSPGPADTADPINELLATHPGVRLKLMATPRWNDETVQQLEATGVVDVVDLKGQHPKEAPVAVPADPGLYRRVLRAFEHAWIEDPGVTAATEPMLRAHQHRITCDVPIRCRQDVAALPVRPPMINMKPSRFGTLKVLLDTYDYCARAGIGMYGGGQFELDQAEHRSSCWRRSSTPTPRTTSRPPATTNARRTRSCPIARYPRNRHSLDFDEISQHQHDQLAVSSSRPARALPSVPPKAGCTGSYRRVWIRGQALHPVVQVCRGGALTGFATSQ